MPSSDNQTLTLSGTSRQQVREALRDMILGGVYPPGSRLIQHALARQLGTSITMVREVLLELRAAGLIEMKDNLGFFVCELNVKRLIEIYELRALHEGFAARACCDCASPKDIREFKELTERSHLLRSSGDPDQIKEGLLLDRQLHNRIIEVTGNQTLIQVTRSYWAPLMVCDESQIKRYQETYLNHLEVIEAIESGRADDAELLMRRHLYVALQYMRQLISEGKLRLTWWV